MLMADAAACRARPDGVTRMYETTDPLALDDMVEQSFSLKGRVAIVAGAGSIAEGIGIGRATAVVLAEAGAQVGLIDIDEAAAHQTLAMIASRGGHGVVAVADLTDDAQVDRAIESIAAQLGPIGILVNNAGVVGPVSTAEELDLDAWDRAMRINVTAMVVTTRHVVPHLRRLGGGAIVNDAGRPGPQREYPRADVLNLHMETLSSTNPTPSVAVLGVGAMGGAIARALATKGITTLVANSRGPESLKDFAGSLGDLIRPVTLAEAGSADIVILSVPWRAVAAVLREVPSWENRILIDATNAVDFLAPDSPDALDPANPLGAMGLKAVDLGGRYSSEIVAELAPGAHVVKTFNHIEPELVTTPQTAGGQGVAFLTGDDTAARARVAELLNSIGLFPVDLGVLSTGAPLLSFPGGPLLGLDLVKP